MLRDWTVALRVRLLLSLSCALLIAAVCLTGGGMAQAQKKQPVPHGQDKPPGPALSPAEAIRKMTLPEGFSAEVVACEPDIVNPVAMTIDEKGRFWITESLEYPRSEPGPGGDRIKVLEDTDGDGSADKFTVFAEGLNIPSGIAVGYGGVWVANSPDILFLQDTDGDGRADKSEVVVTGFGRSDTHELPNSLTWGPDGWLYGLNGVFNHSHVKYRGREYQFTCALFRIHPVTRDFELFCEGTSNPWGVAWDSEGSAFISACVIDHLWHLTETGYYHRQGGPYPPFTWKIESIVKHRHQKAAYCGIHYFDSDAYPEQYRDRLYMGNIHGNCINCDVLERDGSTYFARPNNDFVSAHDAWFMPVVQKTGPDGCLYILDWYDQYHCYQDARRDPEGLDRLKGRLYRIRYKETPRAPKFDLAKESDDQLIERLHSQNVYYRDLAQRLIVERRNVPTREKLQKLVLDEAAPRKTRLHALWSLVGLGRLDPAFHAQLLAHQDPGYRAWGIRAAGNMHEVTPELRTKVVSLSRDPSRDVQLQVSIAAGKITGVDVIPVLLDVLSNCGDDKLIPHIVWQNLHPLLETKSPQFIQLVEQADLRKSPQVAEIMPRAIERILGRKSSETGPVVALFNLLSQGNAADVAAAGKCLTLIAARAQTGEIEGTQRAALERELKPILDRILAGKPDQPLYVDAALLATTFRDPAGAASVKEILASTQQPDQRRLQALDALIAAEGPEVLKSVGRLLADRSGSAEFRGRVLAALGRLDTPEVAPVVLDNYGRMEPDLQPKAVELLTGRVPWAKLLLAKIAAKALSAEVLNVNQVRKLLATKDKDLVAQVTATWGTIRDARNPQREEIIGEMRNLLKAHRGDAGRGKAVFGKVCGQCHKIYGEGQEVGPDITSNGRSSFEQLLSNVFDPSLVIGAAYQARTVVTIDGRVLTGLLAEDSPQKIVLKVQGGKLETVPRDQIEETKQSELSMMPEGLEKQLKPEEMADLFAFLCLDKPPSDPSARRLPGSP